MPPVRWTPGAPVLIRYGRCGRLTTVAAVIVVEDTGDVVTVWVPPGAAMMRLALPDGRPLHRLPRSERDRVDAATPVLRASTWSGSGVLMQFPVDEPWSVWFRFLADGSFDGWYGNLETPKVRWERPDGSRGLDASDRELDVTIRADGSWAWKDEEEFAAKTGRDGFWTPEDQHQIRADGERLIARLERREPPFDGQFTDFRADPRWENPVIPTPWDHPHLVEGA